ncbi:MAG: hypothetical protein PHT48_05485 [Dechloromonas sp.]|nr:hypothetical protein [Dechloromonas sp.]
MSGFLLAPTGDGFSAVAGLSFAEQAVSWRLDWAPLALQLVRPDEPPLWAPAWDAQSQCAVAFFGRPRLSTADWQRATGLPGEGGLAARHLLAAWRVGGTAGLVEATNGAVAVLLWEATSRRLHLLTDRAGVVSVYQPTDARAPLLLASHPDVLADALMARGQRPTLDLASLAEQLSIGAVSPPHSFYREIALLPPATHYIWQLAADSATVQKRHAEIYWQPPASEPALSVDRAADELADAMRHACARRPPGKTLLLLSGGADSRGLLFAQPEPSAVNCLTFCDRENLEVSRARAVARVAGAEHHILYRDPEHYGLGARATVRISGGMGSIKDAHFHGFASDLAHHEHSSLVTGCYADYLLKGLALNRQPYRFFGRELPIDRPASYDPDFYQPRFLLAEPWQAAVQARQTTYFGADAVQRYERSPAAIEDLRVRPLVREADAVGRLYLLATQRWDPVLVDTDLLAFYGRLPPQLKINSRAFAQAVLRLLPAAAHGIPNNNAGQCALGWPLWRQWLAGVQELAGSAVRRRLQPPAAAELATWCSWPDFTYYTAHSRVLGELWAEYGSANPEIFEPLLGYLPTRRSRQDWARDTSLFLRVLTLKLWLAQRGY